MEFVYELGLFTAQLVVVAAVIVVSLLLIAAANKGRRGQEEGYIEVRSINERYEAYVNAIREITEDEQTAKARAKRDKQTAKADQKSAKKKAKALAKGEEGADPEGKPRIFVLTFEGDVNASQAEALREEISAVLPEATPNDKVLIRLESPGGVVHGYGLAASQLQRIKDAGIELIVAVDKVAASGGYMMACVGSKILAAPFAIVGSVGVVAQLPNFHRLLKKMTSILRRLPLVNLSEQSQFSVKTPIKDVESSKVNSRKPTSCLNRLFQHTDQVLISIR